MTSVLLLLGGTSEARAFAAQFKHPNLRLVASLAGVTRAPLDYGCETRVGGFGGAEAMGDWIRDNRVAAVIDATHPFATRISQNASKATMRMGVPCLGICRAPWELGANWREFSNLESLADALPSRARVLLTTGRKEIDVFADRSDVSFWLRTIEAVEGLPSHFEPVIARPPFALEDELALMRDAKITHLVTKNAGGVRPTKLQAAEQLGLPILSLSMPSSPHACTVTSADEALAWGRSLPVESSA